MADGEGTAGSILSTIAPVASAIPFVGSLVSAGLTIGGGLLQKDAASKQAEQGAKLRADALKLKPDAIRPEFIQKFRADKAAELGGTPGYGYAQQALAQQVANQVRAIRSTSPSGDTTVNAISNAIYNQNNALNALSAKDEQYRAGMAQETRNDLWNLGVQGRSLEDKRDVWKREDLTAASAFENAATDAKMKSYNTIAGAVGSTVSSLEGNINKGSMMQAIVKALYGQKNGGSGQSTSADNVWNYQPNVTQSYENPNG